VKLALIYYTKLLKTGLIKYLLLTSHLNDVLFKTDIDYALK